MKTTGYITESRRHLIGAALALVLFLHGPTALASSRCADGLSAGGSASQSFLSCHLSESAQGSPQVLWVTGELRQRAEDILDHRFGSLRVRYWGENDRTVWILDEIGKEMPITVGIVVAGGRIESVKILEYRESRGGEVRYPFFTRQFRDLGLEEGGLSGDIDGITGATLSVAAVRKVATLALVFHQHTPFKASSLAANESR